MRNLHGKKILITRSKERFQESALVFTTLGAECISFPTIRIVPPLSWNECDREIQSISRYAGIVFTSANAAEYFFSRTTEGTIEALNALSVYVVGRKTFHTVSSYGIIPAAPPDMFNARQLVQLMRIKGVQGKRILFPKGDRAGNTIPVELRGEGAEVTELVVYRTIVPEVPDIEHRSSEVLGEKADVITFFSPSSIEHSLSLIPNDYLSNAVIAVNGESTASAAWQFGLTPHIIARQPTVEGLAAAITQYYSTNI